MARKTEGLGDRHIRIMKFLTEFQDQHGYSPSIREIGKHISVDSTSLVDYYLDQLCQDHAVVIRHVLVAQNAAQIAFFRLARENVLGCTLDRWVSSIEAILFDQHA